MCAAFLAVGGLLTAGADEPGKNAVPPAPDPPPTPEERLAKYTLLAPDRLAQLPAAEKAAWEAYYARSVELAEADREALEREVAAARLEKALKPKDAGDYKLKQKPGDAWFASPEASALATAMISFQTPAGAWSKHLSFAEPRRPGMQWGTQFEPGEPVHYLGTLDNNSTTAQIRLLASVWEKTQRADCRDAVRRGVEWLLTAQFPNGGWPQVFPLEGKYHDSFTINDDAFAHVLNVLADIRDDAPHFRCLEPAQRARAVAALEKAVRCLLAAQVVQNGVKTGWCAQHDPLTLSPAPARLKEPPALGAPETAELLQFLMQRTPQSPEVVAAVEAGLAWLEKVKITGLARRKVDGKTAYVADPAATEPLWARFYDPATNEPLFAGGLDGIVYKSYNEMAAHNKVGYDYYTTQPLSVVTTQQKKWRKGRK